MAISSPAVAAFVGLRAGGPGGPGVAATLRGAPSPGHAPLPAPASSGEPRATAGALAASLSVAALALMVRGRRHGQRSARRAGRLQATARQARSGETDLPEAREAALKEKQSEEEELPYMDLKAREAADMELLEATGALHLQAKEEAYHARKKWRQENPSPMEKWEMDMEFMARDTERRKLWGDLRKKAEKKGGLKKARKELEIKWNRGFPVQDTMEDDDEAARREKEWMNMWRAMWPAQEAIDPYDPETFGFSKVGHVTGAHGLWGDLRICADEGAVAQGWDPDSAFKRKSFTNWTGDSKRLHLKPPHRRMPRSFRLLKGFRVGRKTYACTMHGIEGVAEAEKYRGWEVYVLEPPPGVLRSDKDKRFVTQGADQIYDVATTKYNTRDALELIGARCHMLSETNVDEQVLGNFALAETIGEAKKVFEEAGVATQMFGQLTAVVPDNKISRRATGRKMAHDLLDITMTNDFVGSLGEYLYDPDPNTAFGKFAIKKLMEKKYGIPESWQVPPSAFERVTYVPFVPDMIARVEVDDNGMADIYFTLTPDYLKKCSFKCRKRVIDQNGLLVIPRGPEVKALLPRGGQSIAVRRRDGKRRPNGTAPMPPEDMLTPALQIYPELGPGVPRPPENREKYISNARKTGIFHNRRQQGNPADRYWKKGEVHESLRKLKDSFS